MEARERLTALRSLMREAGLAAYVVTSSDPHQSEYPPAHWKHRSWLSGFDGSAGTVVVTGRTAGLWTDFRYYLEAEEALAGTGIELFRVGEPDVPDYPEWLADTLCEGDTVGFDELCVSVAATRNLESRLGPRGIDVVPGDDLVGRIWSDRPELPARPIRAHDVRYAGTSRGEKLSALRGEMDELGADYHLVSTLDDIAWLLNIRGSDVPYNPVAVAHLIVGRELAALYVDESRFAPELRTELESDGVTMRPYGEVAGDLASFPAGTAVLLSPEQVSVGLARALDPETRIVEHVNLSTPAKATKNAVELDHLRSAMVRDGVAMVRFLHWLGSAVDKGEVTELIAEAKLRDLRAEGERFVSEAFHTISGYRGTGRSCTTRRARRRTLTWSARASTSSTPARSTRTARPTSRGRSRSASRASRRGAISRSCSRATSASRPCASPWVRPVI